MLHQLHPNDGKDAGSANRCKAVGQTDVLRHAAGTSKWSRPVGAGDATGDINGFFFGTKA
jgi:hypothetical protein